MCDGSAFAARLDRPWKALFWALVIVGVERGYSGVPVEVARSNDAAFRHETRDLTHAGRRSAPRHND